METRESCIKVILHSIKTPWIQEIGSMGFSYFGKVILLMKVPPIQGINHLAFGCALPFLFEGEQAR